MDRFIVLVQGRVSNECAVPGILSRQEACEDDDVSSSLNTSHHANTGRRHRCK